MIIDCQKRSRRLASSTPGYTAVPSRASTTSRVAGTRAVVPKDFPPSPDGIQCVPPESRLILAQTNCGLHRLRVSGLWILKNCWSYFHLVKPAFPTSRTDLTKKLLHLDYALQVRDRHSPRLLRKVWPFCTHQRVVITEPHEGHGYTSPNCRG